MFDHRSGWIWSAHWTAEDKDRPGLMLFRKNVEIGEGLRTCVIRISADTKYKLYVNGQIVEIGPSRGDRQIWFYDTVDLAPFLQEGCNTIGAIVLRYPEEGIKGNHGMFRTAIPGLYLKGAICYADGKEEELIADESWKCRKDNRVVFTREEEGFSPLIIHERVYGDVLYRGWKLPWYDDSFWDQVMAYPVTAVNTAVSPGNLHARSIPYLYRKLRTFRGVMRLRMSAHSTGDWEAFLQGQQKLVIPPHTTEIVEIDAGEEMTGFIHAAFEMGLGAKVKLLYSEAYVQNGFEGPDRIPVKTDRTDMRNGHLVGYYDTYHLYGQGTAEYPENYRPFWFRTFRFLQLSIETGEEPLVLQKLNYEETGYPLEVRTHATASDPDMEAIWEISERTLRRCMHETYEDCPYYEQLQYIMDARQQILYTYAVSADDRLARQCMNDLKRAQRYDGLLNCCYPNCNTNVIPGFSIYYILMLHDHMMYFGDRDMVRESFPTIERILDYYHRHLTPEGYVEKIGGPLNSVSFWSYIDWAGEWSEAFGMPTAGLQGPITMESLLYVLGLQHAAELAEYLGRQQEADMFLEESRRVQKMILKYCTDEDGVVTDGPGVRMYSQHCQVFAVLTHTGAPETLRSNLMATITEPGKYAQCTVAMRFYLFRALEEMELYEYTREYWNPWRRMLENHCTTCVESEAYARSECHAWGALILYELPSVILGVRPAKPGYEAVRIHPNPGYLTHASGSMITPKGEIQVSWSREDGEMKLRVTAPDGLAIIE